MDLPPCRSLNVPYHFSTHHEGRFSLRAPMGPFFPTGAAPPAELLQKMQPPAPSTECSLPGAVLWHHGPCTVLSTEVKDQDGQWLGDDLGDASMLQVKMRSRRALQ